MDAQHFVEPRLPDHFIEHQHIVERPVIEQEGCIAHGQRHQRDSQRRSAQLFGDAARRDQQQHSPYIARIPPLQSSSLQTARSRAGRIRSK